MWSKIGSDSTVPIYEQIVGQVVGAIASGGLGPDDFLPSVREMAGLLLVNPNTVSKAYGELERIGVVGVQRGTGMIVRADAPELARKLRVEMLKIWLQPLLRNALAFGLTAPQISELVQAELTVLTTPANATVNKKSKTNSNTSARATGPNSTEIE